MCNLQLEETLQLAAGEYQAAQSRANELQQELQQLQQEILVRTGAIQTLQNLIQQQNDAEAKEAETDVDD